MISIGVKLPLCSGGWLITHMGQCFSMSSSPLCTYLSCQWDWGNFNDYFATASYFDAKRILYCKPDTWRCPLLFACFPSMVVPSRTTEASNILIFIISYYIYIYIIFISVDSSPIAVLDTANTSSFFLLWRYLWLYFLVFPLRLINKWLGF